MDASYFFIVPANEPMYLLCCMLDQIMLILARLKMLSVKTPEAHYFSSQGEGNVLHQGNRFPMVGHFVQINFMLEIVYYRVPRVIKKPNNSRLVSFNCT